MGATFYMLFAYFIAPAKNGEASAWLNILLYLFGALGGILFSSLHGLISIKLKGNQTISGIAMNILAPAITLVILYLFGEANSMNYDVPKLEWGISALYEPKSFVSLKMFVTILIITISFIALTFTKWGLRFKSVGENPQAADTAGINVNRTKWIAILISGAIAGIAGAIYISEMSSGGSFKSQVNVEGLGFLAIAIVIISRWKTLFAAVIAIIFASLFSLGQQANNIFDNGSKIQPILMMLPYLFTLLILIVFSKPSLTLMSKAVSKISQSIKKKQKEGNENGFVKGLDWTDRKSTRLNSSHAQ